MKVVRDIFTNDHQKGKKGGFTHPPLTQRQGQHMAVTPSAVTRTYVLAARVCPVGTFVSKSRREGDGR